MLAAPGSGSLMRCVEASKRMIVVGSDVHATERDLKLTTGDIVRTTYFFSSLPNLATAPLVSVGPPELSVAHAHDTYFSKLWARHEASGKDHSFAKFHLGLNPDCDSLTCISLIDEHGSLCQLLRARLFDVWKAMAPTLREVDGTFELFNPAHGANMGWHQDGHCRGDYIAHYYISSVVNEETGSSTPVPMDWFEVAMPPMASDEDTTEEEQFSVDFGSGAYTEACRIAASKLVFFPIGSASQQMVIFEDAAVYHRTPLTAHAIGDLHSRRQRPIARFVFHGTSLEGYPLAFGPPPSDSYATQRDTECARHAYQIPLPVAAADGAAADAGVGPFAAKRIFTLSSLLESDLPLGMRYLLHAFASHEQLDFSNALEAYAAGTPKMIAFLRNLDWSSCAVFDQQ